MITLFAQKTSRIAFQNITDAQGIEIAITGMSIVFVVLLLIAGFIATLPVVMRRLESIFPEPDHHHVGSHSIVPAANDQKTVPDEVIAAIGFTMHQRRE